MNIQTIPTIAAITYALIECYKVVFSRFSKASCFIPIIAAFLGAGIGLILFQFCPNLIAANTWYDSLIIGGFSGLAATGVNQIGKQLVKSKDNTNSSK